MTLAGADARSLCGTRGLRLAGPILQAWDHHLRMATRDQMASTIPKGHAP
jgi:hypothetical protein